MYQIDFDRPVRIHFIGIGGISMSGLAEVLLKKGFPVSGSDNRESDLTRKLEGAGAHIFYGQRAENITDDVDLVVYTAAIHPDNPEMEEVIRRGIPKLTRAELLGQLMRNYEMPVAVSGTHGKTTTTSMISMILMEAGKDPTVSVGGMLKEIGGNIRVGSTGYFVTEACEYTNSFLSFFPRIGIILNIEEDHLDFFKDLDDICDSFRKFAQLIGPDGVLIINRDIPSYDKITEGLTCSVVSFSLHDKGADYTADDITYDEMGAASFSAVYNGKKRTFSLRVPGEHNVANALASIALADVLGIGDPAIEDGLRRFGGTDRRFQLKGKLGGITIVDDYAHHPTEISATLKACAQYPKERVVCVFQPHTYTRTKAFFHDFAKALSLADVVVLADIYAARETDDLGISSGDLMEEIQRLGTECHYFPSFDEIENFLLQNCMHGDLLITMGAGDIVKVGEKLLGQ
ncbi:MAG: UDP-N-acetylmuramate--L-alanine ligase [Lachnospiraceae bacterium]|nr:UDP-N-acetylmuramate--L-alanine ligase [Lachnospiraceae bacterium]